MRTINSYHKDDIAYSGSGVYIKMVSHFLQQKKTNSFFSASPNSDTSWCFDHFPCMSQQQSIVFPAESWLIARFPDTT